MVLPFVETGGRESNRRELVRMGQAAPVQKASHARWAGRFELSVARVLR